MSLSWSKKESMNFEYDDEIYELINDADLKSVKEIYRKLVEL